jgi:hypothetical protein
MSQAPVNSDSTIFKEIENVFQEKLIQDSSKNSLNNIIKCQLYARDKSVVIWNSLLEINYFGEMGERFGYRVWMLAHP